MGSEMCIRDSAQTLSSLRVLYEKKPLLPQSIRDQFHASYDDHVSSHTLKQISDWVLQMRQIVDAHATGPRQRHITEFFR